MAIAKKKATPSEEYNRPFPTTLRKLFEERKVTQTALAKYLGVRRQSVGYWLYGDTSPDINVLNQMADYFKVSTDYLLGRTECENPDIEIQAINKVMGLSNKAIENIITIKKFQSDQFPLTMPIINALLTVESSGTLANNDFAYLIQSISKYAINDNKKLFLVENKKGYEYAEAQNDEETEKYKQFALAEIYKEYLNKVVEVVKKSLKEQTESEGMEAENNGND